MYDEAMLRLTGTVEMVIKWRCREMGIRMKEKDKYGVLKERILNDLINDLHRKEPGKQLKFHLHWIRKLRNSLVHPEKFGFAGGTIYRSVREVVNILNKLFLSEYLLLSFFNERKRLADLIKPFTRGLWVLTKDNKRYLFETCKLETAVKAKNKWFYLLSIYPVYSDFSHALENHSYLPVFLLHITDIKIKSGSIEAFDCINDGHIVLSKSEKLQDNIVYQKDLSDWDATTKHNRLIYTHSTSQDIELEEGELFYRHLDKSPDH